MVAGQPGFEIDALAATDKAQRDGVIPEWSEVILDVTRQGAPKQRLELTRAAGEAIIDALHEVMHPNSNTGKSIIESLWDELESSVRKILDEDHPTTEVDKGYANGLTYAIAMMINPYNPNVKEVKKQAVRRAKGDGW